MDLASLVPRDIPFQLLEDITKGFSEERKLGSGAYGTVYEGVYQDGTKIAVKILCDMPGLDDKQFNIEFVNLANIQHDNIVRLVGYGYEARQECVHYNGRLVLADKIKRALCFQYMHNGSLHKHISDEFNGHNWQTRYGIIKGICNGLKYLHEELEPPMYHLDLKPANVLLDENMAPKIADFGLSRLFAGEHTKITKSFIGTCGYLPPEYIDRQLLSNKFDVFSLGVVMIKIMTGHTGYSKSAEMSSQEFIELVHANWRNRLQATPVHKLESYSDQVKICIEIALRCVEVDRQKRPTIGYIVNELNKIEIQICKLSLSPRSLSNDPMTWLDQAERVINKEPCEDLQGVIDALDQLRKFDSFFSSNMSYSISQEVITRVNVLLPMAILKMEGEFKNLLSLSSKPMEPDHLFGYLDFHPSSDESDESPPYGEKPPSAGAQSTNQENWEDDVYNNPPALIERKCIPLLSALAEQLCQAGRQQQCSQVYSEARASALEISLKNLGVQNFCGTKVQDIPWENLNSTIEKWIQFMWISVKLLFAGERQICDQVFQWCQSLRDNCFAAITENSLAMLVSFGEAVTMCKISPEILFVLLDMFKIISELQTEIDTIFVGESCSQMRACILGLKKCLVQSMQKVFICLEEVTENDTSKLPNDGTVHPLMSYVINYVTFLFNDYRSTLEQFCQELKMIDGTASDLEAITIGIIKSLEKNLDAKAKEYQDPALMHIFLMNSNQYLVLSVRKSHEYKDLLGQDWIQRHQRIVQQNAVQYTRLAWSEVLQCLSIQGFSPSGSSKAAVKERFRSFNMSFEEICQRQCSWFVPDSELRETLILSVAELLLPAYRNFVERFGPLVKKSRSPRKYIKYTPEQLEELLGNLFEGKQDHSPFALHSSIVNGMHKLKYFRHKRRLFPFRETRANTSLLQQEEELL